MKDLEGKPIFFSDAEAESAMRRHYYNEITGLTGKTAEETLYEKDLYYKMLKETITDDETKKYIDVFLSGDYKKLSDTKENEQLVYSLMSISNDILDNKVDNYDDVETLNAISQIIKLKNLYGQNNKMLNSHVTDPQKIAQECDKLLAILLKNKKESK